MLAKTGRERDKAMWRRCFICDSVRYCAHDKILPMFHKLPNGGFYKKMYGQIRHDTKETWVAVTPQGDYELFLSYNLARLYLKMYYELGEQERRGYPEYCRFRIRSNHRHFSVVGIS